MLSCGFKFPLSHNGGILALRMSYSSYTKETKCTLQTLLQSKKCAW